MNQKPQQDCSNASGKPPPYLRGPIGWDWLLTAMALPGSALKVGLVLWHYRALNKSLTFRIGVRDIANFLTLSMDTVRRAMHALADVGLIELNCAPGSKCKVTIVDSLSAQYSADQTTKPNHPEEATTLLGTPLTVSTFEDLFTKKKDNLGAHNE